MMLTNYVAKKININYNIHTYLKLYLEKYYYHKNILQLYLIFDINYYLYYMIIYPNHHIFISCVFNR
jgi:hypothetical protein